MNEITEIIQDGDWDSLATWIEHRFGLSLEPETVGGIFAGAHCPYGRYDGCDDCVASWVKVRLHLAGGFRPGGDGQPEVRFSTPLNIGFLCLVEDEEHLERLRGEVWIKPEPVRETLARSKISKTDAYVKPINKTAWRVAPPEFRNGEVANAEG